MLLGGYFSRVLDGRLLLLVLNTNLYKPSNRANDPEVDFDPAGQFDWMRKELDTARSRRLRVGKMHVLQKMSDPPGRFLGVSFAFP